MSARKYWRLQVWTAGGCQEVRASSKLDAYRQVQGFREDVQNGISRVTHVVVQVADKSIRGWQLYERVNLREPRSLPASRGKTAALTPTVGRDRPEEDQ